MQETEENDLWACREEPVEGRKGECIHKYSEEHEHRGTAARMNAASTCIERSRRAEGKLEQCAAHEQV